jgi:hypothetical protein
MEIMDLVEIFAGRATTGEPVREELPARAIGDGTYELLASPSVASNVAKGDVIRVSPLDGSAEIVCRGGNVCRQVFAQQHLTIDEHQAIEVAFHKVLTGSVDGESDKSMCFSIPVHAGFSAIEHFFNDLATRYSGLVWSYGNVYADDTATPLNWWVDSGKD